MQVYKVPYNFQHEEKIFGGYASLRQGIYLLLALFSLGILFIPKILIAIKVIITAVLIAVWCICAFLKIEEINADKYLVNIIKFYFRNRVFVYRR